jgi:hypothetical protein
MYDAKYVIPGIIVFVVLFTSPFWMNFTSASYARPDVKLPAGEKECVEPVEFIRAEHMVLLNSWRDKALREGERTYTSSTGKVYEASLQNTCMSCHANKQEFCDKCHTANAVEPYCWDCHVEPKGSM